MIFFIGKEAPRGGVRVCSNVCDSAEAARAAPTWEPIDGPESAFIYALEIAPGASLTLRVCAVREDCAWKPVGPVGAVTLEPVGEVVP